MWVAVDDVVVMLAIVVVRQWLWAPKQREAIPAKHDSKGCFDL